jgi:hypothetical protein
MHLPENSSSCLPDSTDELLIVKSLDGSDEITGIFIARKKMTPATFPNDCCKDDNSDRIPEQPHTPKNAVGMPFQIEPRLLYPIRHR